MLSKLRAFSEINNKVGSLNLPKLFSAVFSNFEKKFSLPMFVEQMTFTDYSDWRRIFSALPLYERKHRAILILECVLSRAFFTYLSPHRAARKSVKSSVTRLLFFFSREFNYERIFQCPTSFFRDREVFIGIQIPIDTSKSECLTERLFTRDDANLFECKFLPTAREKKGPHSHKVKRQKKSPA